VAYRAGGVFAVTPPRNLQRALGTAIPAKEFGKIRIVHKKQYRQDQFATRRGGQ
jgi:hypothetical protein